MKKKILSILLILVCILSLASCDKESLRKSSKMLFVYDGEDLAPRLRQCGYEVEVIESTAQEGLVGYIYAERPDTEDVLYYMYFVDVNSAKSMHEYIKNLYKAKISEKEFEIDKIEYVLYKSEGVSAEEKGKYYQRFIELSEELEEIKSITYGQSINIVWYGTKQAVNDMKGKTE